MEQLDLKKELKHLYHASAKDVAVVDVPAMNFLMVDGEGDPNTSQTYVETIEALFAVSYTVKFMVRKGELAIDYGVTPLEGLWWADDMTRFSPDDKSNWKWTAMIMQPSFVNADLIERASAEVKKKKNSSAILRVRFASWTEGECAQIMHIGPLSEEGPTIKRLHRFIEAGNRQRMGKHHEIYLSDIRKADPKNWKTIIRQPMQ